MKNYFMEKYEKMSKLKEIAIKALIGGVIVGFLSPPGFKIMGLFVGVGIFPLLWFVNWENKEGENTSRKEYYQMIKFKRNEK